MKQIYLDHAATTRPEPEVVAAMCECMKNSYANPSAVYGAAGLARKELRKAKGILADMLGCTMQEIYFTSGGTEANNWALMQAAGRHAVVSAIEHRSVLLAAKKWGCEITQVAPGRDGCIDPATIEAAIRPETALISVQYANNETGVLQPSAKIGKIAKKHGVRYHCDAVQAFGHVPINTNELQADFISVSAHKLYGPRGIGFLYIRQGVKALPLIVGGGQEDNQRAGTENIAAICGLGVAAGLAADDIYERGKRELRLRELLISLLAEATPEVTELCGSAVRLPGISALLLPGLTSEEAIARLDLRGVMVSGGAACAGGSPEPSHVFRTIGLSDEQARCVIRISTGRDTTEQDITAAAAALADIYSARASRAN